jgi:hypothetical protein
LESGRPDAVNIRKDEVTGKDHRVVMCGATVNQRI